MKQSIRILIALVALAFVSLATWNIAAARSGLRPVGEMEMTGVVESIQPTFWMVSGLPVAIQPSTEIKDVIQVGDLAKVHAQPGAGGMFTAREIELADINTQIGVDDNSSSNSSDDLSGASENEFYGTVTAINGNIYTIDDQQVIINENTEVKNSIQIGDVVKVHAWTAADGSLTAREIELASAEDGSGDDNSTDDSGFDDSGSNGSGSDDHGSDDDGDEDFSGDDDD